MSTEPLLPSYRAATQGPTTRRLSSHERSPAVRVIQFLSFVVFTCAAFISTVWAHRSSTYTELDPSKPAPLLPYFASLFLLTSFIWWIGYLWFIRLHDAADGPDTLPRKVAVWASVFGKFVLAGVHFAASRWYAYAFPGLVQPNWLVVFLAAQAWWDVALWGVYTGMRKDSRQIE